MEEKTNLNWKGTAKSSLKPRDVINLHYHVTNVNVHHQYHHQEIVKFQRCYKMMSDSHYNIIIDTKRRGQLTSLMSMYINSTPPRDCTISTLLQGNIRWSLHYHHWNQETWSPRNITKINFDTKILCHHTLSALIRETWSSYKFSNNSIDTKIRVTKRQ